jgi:hypothetical protein
VTLFSRAIRGAVGASLGLAIALAGCSPAAAPPNANPGAPVSSASAPGAAQSVPPYYAAIWAARSPAWNSPQNVTIRDTYTAKILLTVKPPAPYQTFSFVAGTGVAGRWVVGAQRWHPGLLAAVALSPDPRQLATVVTSRAGYQVQVVAVPSGAVPSGAARSWSAAPPALPVGYKGVYVPTSYDTEFTLCGGDAATGPNAAGFENVGFWVLSARTGRLTAIIEPAVAW